MNKETIPFIFKPGDRAYWLNEKQWVELEENPENPSEYYPLRIKNEELVFTEEGKDVFFSPYFSLLPINPYDPFDPNNPPEFRSGRNDWSFMLNGRPVFEGDILYHFKCQKKALVTRLCLQVGKVWCGIKEYCDLELTPENFCWPDEVVTKKKVAKWAYPTLGTPGEVRIGFTDEMTQEEAQKKFGSFLFMVPGTEREVEG